MPRGRNKALIARRDEMLCHRYHYWTETQRLRFDDTLKILSEEEFFLSEERILTILRANGDTLRELAAGLLRKCEESASRQGAIHPLPGNDPTDTPVPGNKDIRPVHSCDPAKRGIRTSPFGKTAILQPEQSRNETKWTGLRIFLPNIRPFKPSSCSR